MPTTPAPALHRRLTGGGLPYAEAGVDAELMATATCPVCGHVSRSGDVDPTDPAVERLTGPHKRAAYAYLGHWLEAEAEEAAS